MSDESRDRPGTEAEHWKRIDQLLEQALELQAGERASFLEKACGGDAKLRAEVEELLAAHEQAGSFLASPAVEVAAKEMAKDKAGSLAGRRLGPYEVQALLGAGGMGEVYRARDTRLDRTVALKILPTEFASDEERMRRFRREAKAASALNHPNVATIYDVGDSDGIQYIVMEYVEGKTLDELIGRKGMRLNEVLKHGVQIADALAAAHEAGIVHRDLKPGNLMVTAKGQVKVLDFGLAKLREGVSFGHDGSTAATRPTTEEGRIVGTVAYMSPEQAEGKNVDARSDIFSLGCVLYEMVTGHRAFEGESALSTLSAILHQEPKPASASATAIPADLEKLIGRCLRKDPERRIQHMDDVKLALAELKEEYDSGQLQVTPVVAKRATPVRIIVVAVAVIVLIAAGWYWLSRQRPAEPQALLVPRPLTSYRGYETVPSFSPDGNFVAFEWCRETSGTNCNIYIKQIGVEPPEQLTSGSAVDFSPAWSPDGLFIAFLRRLSPSRSAIIIVPQRGVQERVLGECEVSQRDPIWEMSFLAWTPDSKWLAVASAGSADAGRGLSLLSVETLEKKRLTTSPAGFFDSTPAFSPDGRTLAFTRWHGDSSGVFLLQLGVNYEPQGERQIPLPSGELYVCSVAWTPDGKEIVFSRGSHSTGSLWRMAASASAKPRRLPIATERIKELAISPKGNRLAYVVPKWQFCIWRVDLRGPSRTPASPFQLIRSTRNEFCPAYSPDGKRIAFNSNISGHHQIWICNSDGSNAVQLSSLAEGEAYDPRWSPDGRDITFTDSFGGICVMSANGGPPRRLTTGPDIDRWSFWSRDGQSIYFCSNRSGRAEIWKIPAAGGEAVQITRNGGDLPQESPDGRFLYYMKGDPYPQQCSIWRMPTGGGEETRMLDSIHCDGLWAVREEGIYYLAKPDEKHLTELCLHESATGKTKGILMVPRWAGQGLAVSPDGRTILYTAQTDESSSDLMLVENFR